MISGSLFRPPWFEGEIFINGSLWPRKYDYLRSYTTSSWHKSKDGGTPLVSVTRRSLPYYRVLPSTPDGRVVGPELTLDGNNSTVWESNVSTGFESYSPFNLHRHNKASLNKVKRLTKSRSQGDRGKRGFYYYLCNRSHGRGPPTCSTPNPTVGETVCQENETGTRAWGVSSVPMSTCLMSEFFRSPLQPFPVNDRVQRLREEVE